MSDPRQQGPPPQEAAGVELPESFEEDQPSPPDLRLVVQVCLLLIAVLTACYFASDIILPIVLAFVLSLLFQPGMRLLEKMFVPRTLAALLLILAIFGFVVAIGAAMSGPATAWAQKLPDGLSRLQERLSFLGKPIQTLRTFLEQVDKFSRSGAGGGSGPAMSEMLFKGTQHFASGVFETLLILFFLLASGDTFLRKLVEIVPSFTDKRRVVALSRQIEQNISAYLATITLMNALVGIATGMAMWACGLGDPILWGGTAFLLNYVPIMGPLVGVGLFFFAGLLTIEGLWQAALPAGLYLLIHLIEGETVTPMLLARRFTLNPVLVIISLIFWFWMWGVPGAILSVPMLAITKIICDDVKPLAGIGHFLEG
jgi:predicted PurR-regulated permease PerM